MGNLGAGVGIERAQSGKSAGQSSFHSVPTCAHPCAHCCAHSVPSPPITETFVGMSGKSAVQSTFLGLASTQEAHRRYHFGDFSVPLFTILPVPTILFQQR